MSNNQGQNPLPFYLAKYKKQSVTIKRDESYENTIKRVKKSIYPLNDVDISKIFVSTKLADYGDTLAEISEETWTDIVAQIKMIHVGVRGSHAPVVSPEEQTETDDDPVPDNLLQIPSTFQIIVQTPSFKAVRLNGIFSRMTISTIKVMIERKCNIPKSSQSLFFNNNHLSDMNAAGDYRITEGSLVQMI